MCFLRRKPEIFLETGFFPQVREHEDRENKYVTVPSTLARHALQLLPACLWPGQESTLVLASVCTSLCLHQSSEKICRIHSGSVLPCCADREGKSGILYLNSLPVASQGVTSSLSTRSSSGS